MMRPPPVMLMDATLSEENVLYYECTYVCGVAVVCPGYGMIDVNW